MKMQSVIILFSFMSYWMVRNLRSKYVPTISICINLLMVIRLGFTWLGFSNQSISSTASNEVKTWLNPI